MVLGLSAGMAWAQTEKALPSGALRFVALPPCRLADTRGAGFGGSFGPPSLIAGVTRTFPVGGQCGIASTARAASLNVTVVNPDRGGFIGIWPGGDPQPSPLVSSLNYVAGQTVPNAVVAPLGATGAMTVVSVGNADLIVDVNGYYDSLAPVESLNGMTGEVTLVAGANVSLNPSGGGIEIAAFAPQGPVGPIGPQGAIGARGPAGPQGAPGLDAAIPPGSIRSGVVYWDYRTGRAAGPVTILTVSPGKTFILTDIIVTPSAWAADPNPIDLKIYEDATLKTILYQPPGQIHMGAGIPFGGGSSIIIAQPTQGATPLGSVLLGITISGYEF
jgi:hypothetical protein